MDYPQAISICLSKFVLRVRMIRTSGNFEKVCSPSIICRFKMLALYKTGGFERSISISFDSQLSYSVHTGFRPLESLSIIKGKA